MKRLAEPKQGPGRPARRRRCNARLRRREGGEEDRFQGFDRREPAGKDRTIGRNDRPMDTLANDMVKKRHPPTEGYNELVYHSMLTSRLGV